MTRVLTSAKPATYVLGEGDDGVGRKRRCEVPLRRECTSPKGAVRVIRCEMTAA
jgi:hypothetical protein